jgi:PAS domain S-box-containing protein
MPASSFGTTDRLRDGGIDVQPVLDRCTALELALSGRYDAIVIGGQGTKDWRYLLGALRSEGNRIPFILLEADGSKGEQAEDGDTSVYRVEIAGRPDARYDDLYRTVKKAMGLHHEEERGRKSEFMFKSLMQHVPDLVFLLGSDGRIEFCSCAVEKVLGHPEIELIGLKLMMLVHTEDLKAYLEMVERATAGEGGGRPTEVRLLASDERYIEFEAMAINLDFIPDAKGVSLSFRPIAERKVMEKTLRESEEAYRTLFHKSPCILCLCTLEGTFVEVNEKYAQMSGTSREEIVGREPTERDFLSRSLVLEIITLLNENGGAMCGHQTELVRCDGVTRKVLVSARIVKYKGKPHILIMIDDVDDLMEARKALQQKNEQLGVQKEKLQQITDLVPGVVFQSDVTPQGEWKIQFMSQGAERWLGIPNEAWVGDYTRLMDRIHPEDLEGLTAWINEAKGTEGLWSTEVRCSDFRGDYRWFLIRSMPSFSTVQGTYIWTGTITDITERKRREQMLVNANRHLNLMTSMTRHDCLNRATAALGFLELATRTDLPADVRELIERAKGMVRGIDREMEVSKELQDITGKEPSWLKLGPLLSELPQPPETSVNIDCGEVEILANPMVKKVFQNLFDNSVRHGGGVTKIDITSSEGPQGLLISYQDDGVGIVAGDKTRIFERGFGKNTGLGLFLAREVLRSTGMDITEEGTEGQGAHFVMNVPKGYYRGYK